MSHRSFHTEKLLDTKAFAHRSSYTEKNYTQKLLHAEAFADRSFYTKIVFTQKLVHTEALALLEKLLHRDCGSKI